MLEAHERILFGEHERPGIVNDVIELKGWRKLIDNERLTFKALAVGIALGLGLNTLGVAALLVKIFGGP